MRAQSIHAARRTIVFLALLILLPGAGLTPPTPDPPWLWPVDGPRNVTAPFRAPAHEYGAGHRGIDLSAPVGSVVRSPADGVVAFRGVVVDRPLLTIDHGDGLVTTFEPMDSTLAPGTAVTAGEVIGAVAHGGHSPAGQLHLGVRYNDVYINPMLMFGDVPRAILLPCCAAHTGASPTSVPGTSVPDTGAPDTLTREDGRDDKSL